MTKVMFFTPIFNFQNPIIAKNHKMIRETCDCEVEYMEVVGASPENAKSIAYRKFLESDCDYFFNVDADIFFFDSKGNGVFEGSINPIDYLIACNKDVVGGIYTFKRPPCQPSHRPLDLQEMYEKDGKFPDNYIFTIPEGLHEVKWLAGGCMLISRKVIEELMEEHLVPNLPMIYKKEYLSEDFAFCQRCREKGYKIYADSNIKLGHCGNYYYTLQDYEKYVKK